MTFEEFKSALKTYIGERADDETLALVEAMDSVEIPSQEDAMNELKDQLSAALAETEAKEAEWRKRYRDRFFGVEADEQIDDEDVETEEESEEEQEVMTAEEAGQLWLEENGKKYQ